MATIELTSENFEAVTGGDGLVLVDFWRRGAARAGCSRPCSSGCPSGSRCRLRQGRHRGAARARRRVRHLIDPDADDHPGQGRAVRAAGSAAGAGAGAADHPGARDRHGRGPGQHHRVRRVRQVRRDGRGIARASRRKPRRCMTVAETNVTEGRAEAHEHLRTSCGRQLTVGRLALGDGLHPSPRVFVDLGDCSGRDGTGWAGLTIAEARRVAGALLSQAAAAERESGAQVGHAAVSVQHAGGDAYAITVRGHALLVDQPEADGGQDAGATPTELLVASLASCVAFYAGQLPAAARHGPVWPGRYRRVHDGHRPSRARHRGTAADQRAGRRATRAQGRPARRGVALHGPQHAAPAPRHQHRARPAWPGRRRSRESRSHAKAAPGRS